MRQITRRGFLGTVGGAVTLAGTQSFSANAAQDDAPLFSFVIDADPHASIDRDGERTGRDKFRAVLKKVGQLSPRPDFMLILGDVHGDALEEVITETDFRTPIHVVFGDADDKSSRATLRKMFPNDFAETDYRWAYMLKVGSNAGAHTPAEVPIITFVHAGTVNTWTTTEDPGDPLSEASYREVLAVGLAQPARGQRQVILVSCGRERGHDGDPSMEAV